MKIKIKDKTYNKAAIWIKIKKKVLYNSIEINLKLNINCNCINQVNIKVNKLKRFKSLKKM